MRNLVRQLSVGWVCAVLLILNFSFSIPAFSAEDSPVEKMIKALVVFQVALDNFKGDPDELNKKMEMDKVRTKLNELIKKTPEKQIEKKSGELTELLRDLTKEEVQARNKKPVYKIEQFQNYTKLSEKLNKLFEAILMFRGNDPARALEGPSKAIKSIIIAGKDNKLGATYASSNLHEAWFGVFLPTHDRDPSKKALSDEMEELEEKTFPAFAAQRRALSLTALLKTEENKKIFLLPHVQQKLKDLKMALEDLTKMLEPRIHIISAVYGDLRRYDDSRRRRCNAKAVLRAKCQGQQKCLGNASATDTSLANFTTDLCGYDPYTTTKERKKGLVVRYACVSGTPNFWHSLSEDPRLGPDAPPAQTVILRSPSQALSCNYPPS